MTRAKRTLRVVGHSRFYPFRWYSETIGSRLENDERVKCDARVDCITVPCLEQDIQLLAAAEHVVIEGLHLL
jgi:hypothetical protein